MLTAEVIIRRGTTVVVSHVYQFSPYIGLCGWQSEEPISDNGAVFWGYSFLPFLVDDDDDTPSCGRPASD